MDVKIVPVKELRLSEYNPREITEHDFNSLKRSIEKFGFVVPLVVNKRDHQVIGGHMRLRAARELGHEEVPVSYVDLSEEQSKVLNLALNRVRGRWNRAKLERLLYELSQEGMDLNLDLTGFEDWELELYNPGDVSIAGDLEEATKKLDKQFGPEANKMVLYFHFKEPTKYQEMRNLLAIGKSKEGNAERLYEKFKGELSS